MASQAIALAHPGRLLDHLQNTKEFHLRQLKYLVLDEADRMLSMDFEKEINAILESMPDSTGGRRTMLFSATMTSKVEKLQRASLLNPVRIEVSTKFQTPKKLTELLIHTRQVQGLLPDVPDQRTCRTVARHALTSNDWH